MLIIPAIDLLGGKAVRLVQGKEKKALVYSDRPLQVARQFENAGAKWIHVVDLDGAFGRFHMNDAVVDEVIRNVCVPVELGGGIRSMDRIEHWLKRNVGRVVLGSAAVKDPVLVAESIRRFGSEKIVVGIDIRGGKVAVHGWRDSTPVDYLVLARQMEAAGIRRIILTDIASDGMLSGPRLEATMDVVQKTGLKAIVSGGISGIEDLASIRDKNVSSIEGVIVGKALYEKKLDLGEAVRQFQEKIHA